MTRRGFLGALLALPAVRFLLGKPQPMAAAPVTMGSYLKKNIPEALDNEAVCNVRREMVMGTRAAELRWKRVASLSAPPVKLAPTYGGPLGRTVRVSTEDGEIIWEES
jgi:hypothetical protein